MKVIAFEVPLAFVTVTPMLPALVRKAAGIVAVRLVELPNVVAIE